jgi:hypothetical protein
LFVRVSANADNTTSVVIAGDLDPEASLPATTRFLVPHDFRLEGVWELQEDYDDHHIVPVFATQDIDGWTEYTVELTSSTTFSATFLIASAAYDPTAMEGGAILASMEVKAPNDLATLAIGFEAPPGYVGTGTDVIELGDSESDFRIFGFVFENVAEGEIIDVPVAFVRADVQEEHAAEEEDETTLIAPATTWFTPERIAFLWIGAALLIAIALLIILLAKQRRN